MLFTLFVRVASVVEVPLSQSLNDFIPNMFIYLVAALLAYTALGISKRTIRKVEEQTTDLE